MSKATIANITDDQRNELANRICAQTDVTGCRWDEDVAGDMYLVRDICREVLGEDILDAYGGDYLALLADLVRR